MTNQAQFSGARSKVQRTNRHIDEFVSKVRQFLDSDFCRPIFKQDKEAGAYTVEINAAIPYPPEIPLIIGDAVHNLRSAFDHTVVQFAGSDNAWIALPRRKERDDVKRAPLFRMIEKTFPKLSDFILDEIQPYEKGKFKFWELAELDNIDKHRLLIPTLNIQDLFQLDVEDEHGDICARASNVTSVGWTIWGLKNGPESIKIHHYGNPAKNVLFGEGTPFPKQSVLETLTNISKLTLEAIKAFEFLGSGDAINPTTDNN